MTRGDFTIRCRPTPASCTPPPIDLTGSSRCALMCRDDPDRNVLHYNGFLDKGIDPSLPEYAILKNGMVVSGEVAGAVRRRIAILCKEHQARNLLALARSLQSPAVEDIEKALVAPRDALTCCTTEYCTTLAAGKADLPMAPAPMITTSLFSKPTTCPIISGEDLGVGYLPVQMDYVLL